MIKFTVEIDSVAQGGNKFGVGVRIVGELPPHGSVPDGEGATMIGIGMAINDYMRARGVPDFNVFKGVLNV